MGCEVYDTDIGRMWICGKGMGKPNHCAEKGCLCFAEKLCDYPVGRDKTCDRKLCKSHAYPIAYEMDFCPTHRKMYQKYIETGEAEWRLSEILPLHKHREIKEGNHDRNK